MAEKIGAGTAIPEAASVNLVHPLQTYFSMITDTELDHIAKLGRVDIVPEKRDQLKKDLSSILGYIEKLNQADTSSVEPLYQTTGLVNAVRTDEPRGEFVMNDKLEKLLLDQAPARKDRFVKVKSIMTRK